MGASNLLFLACLASIARPFFFMQGPGEVMVQFCMASLLATLVLDDEVMELIKWVARSLFVTLGAAPNCS